MSIFFFTIFVSKTDVMVAGSHYPAATSIRHVKTFLQTSPVGACRWQAVSATCDMSIRVKMHLRTFCQFADGSFPASDVTYSMNRP
jgi:hypothetical protein